MACGGNHPRQRLLERGEGKPNDFGVGEEVVKEWADIRETFRSAEIEEKYASQDCTRGNDEFSVCLVERTGDHRCRALRMEAASDRIINFRLGNRADEIRKAVEI